jgi:uncharacterized membrane protein HdeD (DUF308 family)
MARPYEAFILRVATRTDRKRYIVPIINLNWGWIALRGVFAILFGILAIARPGLTLAAIVVVFGIYAIIDGVYLAVTSVANRSTEPNWGWYFVGGLAGIIVGALTLTMPGISALTLLYFIAVWAILRGIIEMIAAVRLRKFIKGEWVYIFAGLLSIAFGFYLIARPAMGSLLLMVWLGAYAIFFGIVLVVLAFRIKKAGPLVAAM